MVQDRITDGTRIAQLLSSELTGLQTGLLSDVTVVEPDRDAEPLPEGTPAYRIAFRDEVIATVFLFPSGVEIRLDGDLSWIDEDRASESLDGRGVDGLDSCSVDSLDGRGIEVTDIRTLRVHTGAAVKQSVDALREIVERELRS